jgi:N-acetylneuraminic acid mutarotase
MLRKQNFLYTACKSMLVILCIMCFTSISLAQGWELKAPMPTARGWLSTCAVNDTIYAVGGALDIGSNLNVLEVFDPATNTWDTTKAPMPTPRGCAAACAVDGIIYVFGGGWYTVYSTVEAYNPATDEWTTKAPMPTARSGLSVCEVDGIIYAISGFVDLNSNTGTNTVEAYDPQTNQWTQKAPIPTARAFFSTSVVNGIIYAIGGFNGMGTPSLGNVEAYDPVNDEWIIKNDMPNPRAAMTTCTVDGNIYGFGGVAYGGGPCYSTIIKYNPASDSWEELSDMPYAVFSLSSSIVNGRIYLIGGLNNARVPLDIVYEGELELIVPVELVSFTATSNGKEVILNWSTATELNNQLFEVQRSFEGSDFATIGFAYGKGTTTERQDYTYSDKILADGKYSYRLKQIDYLGSYEYSDIIEIELRVFNSYLLEQNYPNPFNPTTTISFGIQNKSNVKITILNAIGEEIAMLINEEKESGFHTVDFNAANLPSGVYFYQLKATPSGGQAGSPSTGTGHGFVETKKMILMK